MVNGSACTIELWCTREVAKHERSVSTNPACFACICINQVWSRRCQHNFAFERQLWINKDKMVNKQFSQPNIPVRSENISISCERGYKRAVFAHNSPLGWKRSTHRKNSATFPSQKTDVTPFQLKWPMKQISKRKSTFKNTIYRRIASSLVS